MSHLPTVGRSLGSLPFELQFQRTIEEFDGPILTESRSVQSGALYLKKWCARDRANKIDRFLLVRTDSLSIALFASQEISMLDLLERGSDGFAFLIDQSQTDCRPIGCFAVSLAELPQDYLPSPHAYHDEDLAARTDRVTQYLKLPDAWTGELIAKLERDYADVCAVVQLSELQALDSLPEARQVASYEYRGGYAVATAFGELKRRIPLSSKVRAVGVMAASPGVLSFEVDAGVAEAVYARTQAVQGAQHLFEQVHKWAKRDLHEHTPLPVDASAQLQSLLGALKLHWPLPPGDDEVRILKNAKLTLSFFRKLARLAKPDGSALMRGRLPASAAHKSLETQTRS